MNKDNCREEMELEKGKHCTDCYYCERCVAIFAQKADATHCQFHPKRFVSNREKQERKAHANIP